MTVKVCVPTVLVSRKPPTSGAPVQLATPPRSEHAKSGATCWFRVKTAPCSRRVDLDRRALRDVDERRVVDALVGAEPGVPVQVTRLADDARRSRQAVDAGRPEVAGEALKLPELPVRLGAVVVEDGDLADTRRVGRPDEERRTAASDGAADLVDSRRRRVGRALVGDVEADRVDDPLRPEVGIADGVGTELPRFDDDRGPLLRRGSAF